jgi:hypothetical protein
MQSFMKMRPVEAELLHTDGERRDMKKLVVAFCNFAKNFD